MDGPMFAIIAYLGLKAGQIAVVCYDTAPSL